VVASKRNRVVYLEKSGLSAFEASKWFGIYHYALKVGKHGSYDWYEVAGNKTKQMKIKHWKPVEHRPKRRGLITTVGSTYKSNEEIDNWIKNWERRHPNYNAFLENCQEFAFDLARWLCPGSNKIAMPESQDAKWIDVDSGSGNSYDDTNVLGARVSTFKTGAQGAIFGIEAEGPNAGVRVSAGDGRYESVWEAALSRAEVKAGPIKVRVEPNVNTGAGYSNGNIFLKALGFGVTGGVKGLGVHTPLGTLCFGSC